MTRIGCLALGLCFSCTGPTDMAADSGVEPTDNRIQDSEAPYPYFDVGAIYLTAEFAYNGSRLVTGDIDGQSIAPMIYYTFATAEWDRDPSDVENYCIMGYPLSRAEMKLPDMDFQRLWFGYAWNSSEEPLITTCNTPGYELDPRRWERRPLNDFFNEEASIYIAIGEMSSRTAGYLAGQSIDIDPVGGVFGLPKFTDSVDHREDFMYALPYATDESGRARFGPDGLVPIPSVDLRDADGQIPALYSVWALTSWRL